MTRLADACQDLLSEISRAVEHFGEVAAESEHPIEKKLAEAVAKGCADASGTIREPEGPDALARLIDLAHAVIAVGYGADRSDLDKAIDAIKTGGPRSALVSKARRFE